MSGRQKHMVNAAVGSDADSINVHVDHNAAYWVRGKETGKVELW